MQITAMFTVKRLLDMPGKGLRWATFWLLRIIFLRNSQYFYSRYFGSDQSWVLFLKNLVNPGRFLNKIQYGSVGLLPKPWLKGEPAPMASSNESKQWAAQLERDGMVIFPEAHPEIADHILKTYAEFFNSTQPSPHYHDLVLREIDQSILELMVNEKYLQIMAEYYKGRQPYLRATGALKVTNPIFSTPNTRDLLDFRNKFNTNWHYDTVNMVQIHFLLHDLKPEDTHMNVAQAEHRTHRVNLSGRDYYYSDEYVKDHYNVIPVCGKKGTVFLWDSNAPHRAHLVIGRPRSFVQLLYSPGNNILTQESNFGKEWAIVPDNLNLDQISPLCRNALKYVIDDRRPEDRVIERNVRLGIQYAQKKTQEIEISNF